MPKLSPAAYVIKTIGGVRKTARSIGRTNGAISKWTSPKGTGGRIPTGAQAAILRYAKKKGLDIKPADLVIGR